MKQKVMLSIRGRQSYMNQEPEQIELVTEGTLEFRDNGWDICYEESELTGLSGVTTLFRCEPDKIILNRSGKLRSQMVFQKGVTHESLYQMEFGALMISVNVQNMFFYITPDGGSVDLVYEIEIENTAAGVIDYHLEIKTKE